MIKDVVGNDNHTHEKPVMSHIRGCENCRMAYDDEMTIAGKTTDHTQVPVGD